MSAGWVRSATASSPWPPARCREAEFTAFLTTTLGNAASVAKDGAIAFVCMDWRHMRELLDAGEAVFSELKNLCVWNKTQWRHGQLLPLQA